MEAYIKVDFSKCDPGFPSLDLLESLLTGENIINGVIHESLNKILTDRSEEEVLVARGMSPVKSTPAYIKVKKELYESRPPVEKGGQIDYKMVSPFVMVKKGSPIARRIEESEGQGGWNIHNEAINPEKKNIEQLQPGENILEKGGVFYAVKSGRFELEDKIFQINEVLDIAGNVDYSTGHISFPGDVIIHGQIKDGFRVAAGGSIHCMETLDASEVFTRKDLIIEGGIIGRNTGVVRVQGKIETKFIEHCHVESLGGIAVKSSIADCEISTLGDLELLKNGKLIGGTVYAEKSLTVHTLGSPSNGNIKIFLGISFVEARHLIGQQKILHEILEKKEKIKSIANEKKREELEKKVESAIERIQKNMADQIVKQYTCFGAELRVSGTIYPGAQITICDRTDTVLEKKEKVIVFYDASRNQIGYKPYK
ncbi:MAG: DUF342 domain-containing protein [Spirochaetales bacterium]|nr:DUF342 domain-containing protein [Spirochaetales bacterium]